MKIINIYMFIILVFLTGCFPYESLTYKKNYELTNGNKNTPKNITLTANIGDVLYEDIKFVKKNIYGYKNEKPIVFPAPYFSKWDGIGFDKDRLVTVDSLSVYSEIIRENKSGDWVYYDFLKDEYGGMKVQEPIYFVVNNGKLTKISYLLSSRFHAFKPPIPVKYEIVKTEIKTSFSFELLYQGIQNNSIVLTYREYSDEMIRGNFTQNAYYNLNEIKDNIIQYKSIKIKIIEYNNQYLKYMILD